LHYAELNPRCRNGTNQTSATINRAGPILGADFSDSHTRCSTTAVCPEAVIELESV